MKLGTENKLELWTAIILASIAAVSVGTWLLGSNRPTPSVPTAANAPRAAASSRPLINPLDPTLRLDLLDSAQSVKYEGKGRDIFKPGAPVDIPPVKTPPLDVKKQNPNPVPPPPPQPPRIDLKFFGVASRAGEPSRIFLSQGDSIFVAREGDIVNSRYKVVKINPQSVEIEDLLNNNRQSIPLTQG